MNVIKRLEKPNWESTVSASEVNLQMAKDIMSESIPVKINKFSVVARIQVLLVNDGKCTDEEFVGFVSRDEA